MCLFLFNFVVFFLLYTNVINIYRSVPQKATTTNKMTDRKAVIKNADMSEDMQQDAVDCATQAIEKYNIEKVCLFLVFLIVILLFCLFLFFRI